MAVPDRELIRRIVVEILSARSPASSTSLNTTAARRCDGDLLVLHDGDIASLDELFLTNVKLLRSHFRHIVWNMPPHEMVKAILMPDLSPQRAAALANGTSTDSMTETLLLALSRSVPVWAAAAAETIPGPYSSSNPALTQLFRRNRYALRSLGIRFLEDSVVDEIIAHVAPTENLTPERLAFNRPFITRRFVTTEDVYNARMDGKNVIRGGANTVVTDEARSLAEQFGIVIE